jgi:Integrase core domain
MDRSAALRAAGISSGTWRHWRRWQQAAAPPLAKRGRPPRCASHAERQAATRFLVEHGSQVPLHALQEHLPEVPRAELADLRRRYQQVCQWRRARFRGRLIWKLVGAVWAVDFTEVKEYIGGSDRWILAIRDLASGYQLAWLSFTQATAEGVVEVLLALFLEHGAPLVLKSDNGSQFIAQVTLSLLARWQVLPLFNPPRRPAYNGGLERTHPILKGYTAAAAQAQGRPAALLPEDLETGRQNANRFTRKLGPNGPTADEMWRLRPTIEDDLRQAFEGTLQAERLRARAARGLESQAVLGHYQQAAVDRDAIRDALIKHDLLEIEPKRRRRGARRRTSSETSTAGRVPSSTACGDVVVLHETSLPDAGSDTAPARLAPSAPQDAGVSSVPGPGQESYLAAVHLPPTSGRIMPASVHRSPPWRGPNPAGPTHSEPDQSHPLRRLITPLINLIRRAKIR